jgi:diguanylate cyclase (GGDEF)-like protein
MIMGKESDTRESDRERRLAASTPQDPDPAVDLTVDGVLSPGRRAGDVSDRRAETQWGRRADDAGAHRADGGSARRTIEVNGLPADAAGGDRPDAGWGRRAGDARDRRADARSARRFDESPGRRVDESPGRRFDESPGRRADDLPGRRADDGSRRRAGDGWLRRAGDLWDRRADAPSTSGDLDTRGEVPRPATGLLPAGPEGSDAHPVGNADAGNFGAAAWRTRTEALRTQARMLRLVVDETRDALLVFDSLGDVVLGNRALEELLGAPARLGYGPTNLRDVLEALGAHVDANTLDALLARHFMPRMRLQLEDGNALEFGLVPLSLETAGDHRLMIFGDAVVAGAELTDLRHRAFHDRLTGLPNRELLLDRLEQALGRLGRDGGAVAVIFVDLDGFKQINDEHGHAMGDRVLVEVAARLMREIRQVDTVGRLGGDEFVIVCDGVAETQSVGLICNRIQRSLRFPIEVEGRTLELGASIGAVVERTSGADAAEVLHRADKHMYRAKREGTQTEVAVGASAEARQRGALTRTLRTALEHGALDLVYLPLVAFGYEQVTAVEALLRCSDPGLDGIGPVELVELAEEAGVLHQLNRWILREAAAAAAALSASTQSELSVLVNLSGGQLADPALGSLIAAAAADAGIERRRVGLDIAERVIARGSAELERQLDVLVELGCQLFADEITGPTVDVELLSELGFSAIKLDRSVIATSIDTPSANAAAKVLVTRARELHLSVVGQGIADEKALQTAREIGCNSAQGYGFFGFPRPLDQLTQLIH